MDGIPRITPEQARGKVLAGEALLVCAYDDPKTYASLNLEGSIAVQRLREMVPSLPRDREIVCYCA